LKILELFYNKRSKTFYGVTKFIQIFKLNKFGFFCITILYYSGCRSPPFYRLTKVS